MTKDELITALESAEVGSRELDKEIARYCNWKKSKNQVYGVGDFLKKFPDVNLEHWGFPLFTTSLDASLPSENIVLAKVLHVTGRWQAAAKSRTDELYWARAHTEPLARCIAALKAMENSQWKD